MKRMLVFILIMGFQQVSAQNPKEKISLSVENAPLMEVVQKIEDETDLWFYFVEDWIRDLRISGDFQNTSIENILEEVFEGTSLNFYFLNDNSVVLTQNLLIYDELPEDYFRRLEEEGQKNDQETAKSGPIFFDTAESEEQSSLETITIGRETRNNNRTHFILKGHVTDSETNEPISHLAILVQNKNIGAVTDSTGYYELRLPAGQNILETKSLGTEDYRKRVIIYNDGELNISLKENFEQLGEIIIASNSDENVKQTLTGVEKINVRAIKNIPLVLGERDILKVATTLPGISTAGEGSTGYNVRGGRADQNLILLDDAVIYNPSHFFGIFSALNPFTSGDVSIYKGSIPAQYGGRLSSVFDISTRDASLDEFGGEASVGPVTSNLALDIPVIKEKAGLLVGGRSTYSNWILKSLDDESLKDSKASFYDIVVKYNHIINDHSEIEATGYFSHDLFSITSDSIHSYNNNLVSLRYNRSFNEKNRGSLILSNSGYKFNVDYESEFDNNFTSEYDINETEVKLNLKHIHSGKHQFDYGVASKLYLINPGSIQPLGSESLVEAMSIQREKGLESAIYLAHDYKVSEKLQLNTGLRFSSFLALGEGTENVYREGVPKSESTVEEVRNYGNNELIETYSGPEIRFSGRYFILPDLSVKMGYSNTYQYIHTLTNNTTMSPTDTYKLSDLHIEPQTADQWSLGLYSNLNQNMYELSLEGFYKESDNMLDFKVGANLFLNEQIETEVLQGEGRSYGVEFLMKKTTGRLNGWLGYSYTRSLMKLDGSHPEEIVNNGNYFPANFDKPHDLSIVANYKLTQRFSFSANFVYQTGRPVTYPIGKYSFHGSDYVMYSDRNKFRIPDYYRLDLSFNMEGNHKLDKIAHSFWNFSVYNVLGRNNPYSVFFVTENGNIKALQSSIFSIPVPTISYNIKF